MLKSSSLPPYQECSQLQELSICLYNKVMQAALWYHKRQLKKVVQRGLLPLFFHLSDQTQSVAKVRMAYLTRGTSRLTPQGLPGCPGPGLKVIGHLACVSLRGAAACVMENGGTAPLLPYAKRSSHSPPTALSHRGLGKACSPAKRWALPGPLPWALVPSLSLCCSAGLPGSPCHRCRLPEAGKTQAPGADRADPEDRRVLGKDNSSLHTSKPQPHRARGWEMGMA